jgi:hypothetical protein
MALTFYGSGEIPFWENMTSKNEILLVLNTHFLLLRVNPLSESLWSTALSAKIQADFDFHHKSQYH